MVKMRKVVLYISEEDYKKLRIKLITMGESVSGWFRLVVQQFLSQ